VSEVTPLIPPETITEEQSPSAPAIEPTGSRGFWAEAWRRFRRRKLAMIALGWVVLLLFVAALAPAIVGTKPIVCRYQGEIYFPAMGYFNSSWENPIFTRRPFRRLYTREAFERGDPEYWAVWPLVYQDPKRRIENDERERQPANPYGSAGSPNQFNLFGTDQQGIDVFAQMVHATITALLVGFVSTGIAASIGIPLGALAGYLGGKVDMLLSRLLEVVLCIPSLVLILALIAIVDRPTIWHVMAVLGATQWTSIARLTRGEFIKLRETEFVAAARALGSGPLRIMFRHILPNALAPVLVPITFGIASAILLESALSFIGWGGTEPSWGKLLSAARSNLQMWWLIVFPGGAIFLAVLAYNLIGEGLQEATDPRLREAGK
jgi:peptide/nickel transport system permease protein